ncbi:MAG: hypothetical protein QOJ16_1868 [Acidobacteriota bacterium]|jgi:signal transduction histidine kinase|nr:hypothetical protein [Acidobacteriota bacterium]
MTQPSGSIPGQRTPAAWLGRWLGTAPAADHRPAALRYGFAAVMAALAVAVRLPFHELLQNAVPFLFFFPAIMASAWFGGLGPGLLTTAISAVLADFLYLRPAYAWSFTLLDFIQIALFLAVGSVISGLSEALHAARRRVTIDLSDRAHLLARAEEARFEAEAANRAKDEFLATLSHELRTPLNAILGWAEMLLLKSSDPALLERGLTSISRSARAQAQLIEDLLDVSGIISGKMRLDARPIELAPVVEAALESVRPAALAKEIRLQRVFASTGTVHGDPDRLQQVVWNLLANAVKFTPKGGRSRSACGGSTRTPKSSSPTAGWGSPPISSPTSSSASARPTPRPAGSTVASVSGSPSSATWSSCTAARSRRGARARARGRPSPSPSR